MPALSRLKSIKRIFCLCPPPRCQLVRSPALRRPALDFFGDVNGLYGRLVVRSSLTSVVLNLCDGVNGLYVLIAIVFPWAFSFQPSAFSLNLYLLLSLTA